MNFWSVVGLILSSSLLTAFITISANWYIHKDKYKKEYYKLLLQRRLQAYELIDEYISNVNSMTWLDNELIHTFIYDNEILGILIIRMVEAKKNANWISLELSEKLAEFNVLLINIETEINNNIKSRKIIAIEQREEIRKIKMEIFECIKKDFQSLHDIKKFLDTKGNNDLKLVEFVKDKSNNV